MQVTAWAGLSAPPAAYAACCSPPSARLIPVAIITAPTSTATSSVTRPARTARRMLGATCGAARQEATVRTAITAISTPPPAASARAANASKDVSRLKCDGTRRQACSVIKKTSSTQAPANSPAARCASVAQG